MGLAGFDISYVKMMHFAILEMPRGGIVSLGLGGRAVGVGGGWKRRWWCLGRAGGPVTRFGEGKTRRCKYETRDNRVDGKTKLGGKA